MSKSKVVELTCEGVNRFMGRKPNQALYAKALEGVSGVEFDKSSYNSFHGSSFSQCSKNFFFYQKFQVHKYEPRISVEMFVYAPVASVLDKRSVRVNVSVLESLIDKIELGCVVIEIDSMDNLRNPGLLFQNEKLIAMFDEAKKLIADPLGWVNEQIVLLAFKTRDAMFKQAEEILAATIAVEESNNKSMVVRKLCCVDYRDAAYEARTLQGYLTKFWNRETYRERERAANITAEAAE